MRFEINHEFDAPLDAIELAILSPELGPLLVANTEAYESVETIRHEVSDREFHRVWRFQARAPLKILQGREITREMMSWDEHSVYRLGDHAASWYVMPRGDQDPDAAWRKHFSAEGSYRLDPLSDGRTRRTVVGEMVIDLKVIGTMVERIALREVKKAYDAEAIAIRQLCHLP